MIKVKCSHYDKMKVRKRNGASCPKCGIFFRDSLTVKTCNACGYGKGKKDGR